MLRPARSPDGGRPRHEDSRPNADPHGRPSGLLYLNLRIAQRGLVANPLLLQLAESEPRLNLTVALRRLSVPAVLAVGLLAGLGGQGTWDHVLLAIHRTPFGLSGPVFGRDIGF